MKHVRKDLSKIFSEGAKGILRRRDETLADIDGINNNFYEKTGETPPSKEFRAIHSDVKTVQIDWQVKYLKTLSEILKKNPQRLNEFPVWTDILPDLTSKKDAANCGVIVSMYLSSVFLNLSILWEMLLNTDKDAYEYLCRMTRVQPEFANLDSQPSITAVRLSGPMKKAVEMQGAWMVHLLPYTNPLTDKSIREGSWIDFLRMNQEEWKKGLRSKMPDLLDEIGWFDFAMSLTDEIEDKNNSMI